MPSGPPWLAACPVRPETVAPRTGQRDVAALAAPREVRAAEPRRDAAQPGLERVQIRQHEADRPAETLRLAFRQMELLATGVDPHIGAADRQMRVAGQPQSGDVEIRRRLLVRDRQVNMLEENDVADVLGPGIEAHLRLLASARRPCRLGPTAAAGPHGTAAIRLKSVDTIWANRVARSAVPKNSTE